MLNTKNRKFHITAAIFAAAYLFAMPAMAEQNTPRTLQVQGNSNLKIDPNMATVQIAVETTDSNAKKAMDHNAEKMTRVMAALKDKLGANDRMATASINLVPQYQYDKETQRSVLSGYMATNMIVINTKLIDKLGSLLDMAIQSGANRVENVQFSHDDWHQYEQKSLALAVKDAKETAEILAKAADVTLGKILEIKPQQANGIVPMRAMLAKSDISTPVVPGELVVSMDVAVVYEIN